MQKNQKPSDFISEEELEAHLQSGRIQEVEAPVNFRVSHYFELPDGSVIVTGQMDQAYREALEAEADTTALPFILSGEKIPAKVAASLAHLGITKADNTMQAALKITKVHPAFHPSQF